jgi:hypothetical protein
MSGKLKSPVSITLGTVLLWVSLLSELFRFSSDKHSLQQCVTEPTREKNILDLVLTTNENLVHKVDVMDGMSDYQMIITTINARPKIIMNKPRKVYLYPKGNLDAVKEYLDINCALYCLNFFQ